MSQSCNPVSNHSASFASTELCSEPLATHSRSIGSNWPSAKNRCSDSRQTGLVPDTVETGSLRSAGVYVAPQFSQLSPYWSAVEQTGQVPRT